MTPSPASPGDDPSAARPEPTLAVSVAAEPEPPSLAALGWDASWQAAFEAVWPPGLPRARQPEAARVLRRDRTMCLVGGDGGERQVTVARHLLVEPLEAPTTGDFVAVAGGEITAVLERRTSMMRSGYRDLSAQVLAANVDTVLVVVSLDQPWRARRVERLLVVAWQTAAIPVVVLSKADRCDDPGGLFDAAAAVAPGCAVHVVSAFSGRGVDALAHELAPGTTTVMIGTSGAGKTTLANALADADTHRATSPMRTDGKGRHTTVARELVRLRNGALMIDTPGLRAIGLWDAEEALGEAFSDVEALAEGCRFGDCAHESEPSCAVKAAIQAGELDRDRLASFRRLQREQQWLAARTDARLRALRNAEWKQIAKRQKETYHR